MGASRLAPSVTHRSIIVQMHREIPRCEINSRSRAPQISTGPCGQCYIGGRRGAGRTPGQSVGSFFALGGLELSLFEVLECMFCLLGLLWLLLLLLTTTTLQLCLDLVGVVRLGVGRVRRGRVDGGRRGLGQRVGGGAMGAGNGASVVRL